MEATRLLITKSIFAGLFISIGAITYLHVGGVLGAVLFAFGLISIVEWGCLLFTGSAGFIEDWQDFFLLLCIIAFNIVGCLIGASIVTIEPDIVNTATSIIESRLTLNWIDILVRSAACGMIMTTAVYFSKSKNIWLPLLFGVPVFIICGFPHCIADNVYFWIAYHQNNDYLNIYGSTYALTVLGNFIGCNLYRLHY